MGALGVDTITYKRVDDLAIRADVYRDPSWTDRPAVVWIHGGALIMGNRGEVPAWLLAAAGDDRFVVASIDYRLAPETKLPAIIEDVEDAFAWLRGEGRQRFGVDPGRVGVAGGSAGGYLSLTAGFRVRPHVRAVVSHWGYGDLIGDWYTQPSPHPCHHEVTPTTEEAVREVSGPPISDDRDRPGNGWIFYQYCRQHGTWPSAVSDWDPVRDAERFTPYMPIDNVAPDYPPTLLLHGQLDTDVPHDRSELVAAALSAQGVEHELLSIPGAEHGLDGVEPAVVGEAVDRTVSFLREHLARG